MFYYWFSYINWIEPRALVSKERNRIKNMYDPPFFFGKIFILLRLQKYILIAIIKVGINWNRTKFVIKLWFHTGTYMFLLKSTFRYLTVLLCLCICYTWCTLTWLMSYLWFYSTYICDIFFKEEWLWLALRI